MSAYADSISNLRLSVVKIEHFEASDGYVFHYRHWKAARAVPRGYVVSLHGIQSHSGWYEYSSRRLAEDGYDVRFLDRRGSGMNEQQRGHTPHFSRLVNDVAQFLAFVRHESNRTAFGAPLILQAVSWGGKLAAAVAAARPDLVDALSLLYPGIHGKVRVRWHERILLRLAQSWGMTYKRIPIPLDDPALFTDGLDWRQFIFDDPLMLHEATVGFLNASIDLDREVQRRAAGIQCPTLVMLAGRDRIIDNDKTRRYFGKIGARRRVLYEYAEAAHTLDFEQDRDRIFDDLLAWLGGLTRPALRIAA
jgi:alpha-beta hydrolase superfamily lysophospholipase